MSNIEIVRIFEKDKLIKILNYHKGYLYTLKNGIVNIDQYSEKALKHGFVYAAYLEDELVGFCVFYANDVINAVGFLSMIAVDAKKRNMKIGSLLLKKVIDVCIDNKMTELKLSVRKENTSAIQFYQRNDFEFSAENEENVFFMTRKLL